MIFREMFAPRPFISNEQPVSLRQAVELVHYRPQDFRVKGIVEVHQGIVLYKIKIGSIGAMDCKTFKRNRCGLEISLGFAAKLRRIFYAGEMCKRIAGGDQERPAFPGPNVDEVELRVIQFGGFYCPAAGVGAAGFITYAMNKVFAARIR